MIHETQLLVKILLTYNYTRNYIRITTTKPFLAVLFYNKFLFMKKTFLILQSVSALISKNLESK